MLTIDLNLYLERVRDLAAQAGELILSLVSQNKEIQVDYKSDATPVTAIDKAVNHFIVSALTQMTPDIPVISEEAENLDLEKSSLSDYFWLVDPLDGTKGFIAGCCEYTVNIALIYNHLPVIGVIDAPAMGVAYCASSQTPAECIESGRSRVIRTVMAPAAKRVVISRFHDVSRLASFDSEFIDLSLTGQVNSSLKFCLVAAGLYDFYPRMGPTSLWDTAAAQIIVEQAGGQVVDFTGQRLQYHLESGLLNPEFIAVGDVSIVNDVLEFCAMLRRGR